MNKISVFICIFAVVLTVSACEGCARKAAKKVTNVGLSVLEGVTEAVSERGDTIAEKLTDAAGNVAQGAGRSLNRQLNEHVETVAATAGRTLVQTVEGLEGGVEEEYYDELVSKEELCSDVALDFFGKIKSRPVTIAYFIISKSGTYTAKFEFCTDNCKTVVLTKQAEIENSIGGTETISTQRVSFAYDNDELALLGSAKCTKITVTPKK